MADRDTEEKTEQPTVRRRETARSEGRVAKSGDLAVGASLLAVFLVLDAWGPSMGQSLLGTTRGLLEHISQARGALTADGVVGLSRQVAVQLMYAALPIALVTWLGIVFAYAGQGVWVLTPELALPQWQRVSPWKGLGRVFGLASWVRGLLAAGKLLLVGILLWVAFQTWLTKAMHVGLAWTDFWNAVVGFGIRLSLSLVALAFVDYAIQRWLLERSLRMTRAEIREESLREEGDQSFKEKRRRFLADARRLAEPSGN